MSEQVWLPLIRSSSPQTLGQAVLRLAALAEAAHLHQAIDTFRADDADNVWAPGLSPGSAPGPAPGLAPQDVVAAEQGGRNYTEVDR